MLDVPRFERGTFHRDLQHRRTSKCKANVINHYTIRPCHKTHKQDSGTVKRPRLLSFADDMTTGKGVGEETNTTRGTNIDFSMRVVCRVYKFYGGISVKTTFLDHQLYARIVD